MLPLALLILAAIIQSATLMLIPILNIIITVLAEFLVMYPVALSMDVVCVAPSHMDVMTASSTGRLSWVRGACALIRRS